MRREENSIPCGDMISISEKNICSRKPYNFFEQNKDVIPFVYQEEYPGLSYEEIFELSGTQDDLFNYSLDPLSEIREYFKFNPFVFSQEIEILKTKEERDMEDKIISLISVKDFKNLKLSRALVFNMLYLAMETFFSIDKDLAREEAEQKLLINSGKLPDFKDFINTEKLLELFEALEKRVHSYLYTLKETSKLRLIDESKGMVDFLTSFTASIKFTRKKRKSMIPRIKLFVHGCERAGALNLKACA